jgi:hypothetical protein
LISGGNRDWLNSMTDLLDSALQSAAAAAGVDYISTIGLFSGHELCTADSWFTGILDPNTNDTPAGLEAYVQSAGKAQLLEWLHPNVTGYAQEASLLRANLPIP